MQILKPDMLSCTNQPLDWRGTLHQSFTIGLGFSLLSREDDALLPADEAWAAAMQGLAPGMCMDSGVPKATAEWLLAGSVQAPGGEAITSLAADMRVGQQTRRFLVGHRHAEPWREQPLLWSRTWGSPTHKDNPEGCGLAPDPASGTSRPPLISDADSPHATPACPCPRGVWPCRLHAMGTYGPDWLKERWPGVPDDFDWHFFNLAQPSQWLSEGITPRMPIVLDHVHPAHPRLQSHVPDKSLRIEVLRRTAAPQEAAPDPADWETIPAKPDTLWLFPNQGVGLVLWHTLVPCADEVGGDIEAVRLTLVPEDAQCVPPPFVPPPPPPPQGPPVLPPAPDLPATAEAATGGAVGAVATGAAVAATAVAAAAMVAGASHKSGSSHATASQPAAATTTSPPTVQPSTAPTPPRAEAAPEPGPVPRREALRDGMARALEDFETHKEELNQALADLHLPPLSPEQEAEVRQRLQDGERVLNELHDQMDQSDPTMEGLLRQAGVGEDSIAQARAALELDPPDPMDFDQPEPWRAAVERFIAKVDSVLPLNETARLALREGLAMVGPGGTEKMADMAHMPNADPTLDDMLAQSGLDSATAKQLSSGLLSLEPPDVDASEAQWKGFAAQAEQALGFASGSMGRSIDAFLEARRQMDAAGAGRINGDGESGEAGEAPTAAKPASPGTTSAPPSAASPVADEHDTPHRTDDTPHRADGTPSRTDNAPPPPARQQTRTPSRWTEEDLAKAPPAVRVMMQGSQAAFPETEGPPPSDNDDQEPTS